MSLAKSSQDHTLEKIEALTAAIASLSEMSKSAIQTQPAGARPRPPATIGTGAPGPSVCNFRGGARHYIWECEVINEYIRTGKCKHSADRKVSLASGTMVLSGITGAWFRDCVA